MPNKPNADYKTAIKQLRDALKAAELADVGGINRVCVECRRLPHKHVCSIASALAAANKILEEK